MNDYVIDTLIEDYRVYGFDKSTFFIISPSLPSGRGPHKQEFMEILIVFEGSSNQTVNGKALAMEKGDIYILAPNVIHGLVIEPGFHCCCLLLTLDYIKDNTTLIKLPIIEPLFHSGNLYEDGYLQIQLNESQLTIVNNFISLITNECIIFNKLDNNVINNYLSGLFAYLSKCYETSPLINSNNYKNIFVALVQIENNFTRKIDINILAANAYLSRRQFDRLFISAYKQTPTQYINTLRLKAAISLLQNPSLTLPVIAEQCGYVDASHFIKHFQNAYGNSPTQYRKRFS